MPHDFSKPVKGADDQLIASVAESLPNLPNLRADIADRFAQGVRALVETRAQSGWPGELAQDDVAAFIYVERPREIGERLGGGASNGPNRYHGKAFRSCLLHE